MFRGSFSLSPLRFLSCIAYTPPPAFVGLSWRLSLHLLAISPCSKNTTQAPPETLPRASVVGSRWGARGHFLAVRSLLVCFLCATKILPPGFFRTSVVSEPAFSPCFCCSSFYDTVFYARLRTPDLHMFVGCYSPDSFPVSRPSCSTGKAFPLRGPLAVPALTASQYRFALILFALVFASLLALPPSLPSCCAALFIIRAYVHNTMRSGSHCQRLDALFSHYFRNAPPCPQNRVCRVCAQRRASTRPHTSERLTCASWPILRGLGLGLGSCWPLFFCESRNNKAII